MPERPTGETPREAAERELLAAREEVRQMAESMRARLAEDERTAQQSAAEQEPLTHRSPDEQPPNAQQSNDQAPGRRPGEWIGH